jgi:hypothetical protein
MSLSADQTINDAAAAAKTFALQKLSATESTRIDTGTTLANPRVMSIKHSLSGPKGVDQVDRHLLSFATTKTDGNGKQATTVLNCTIALPRNGVVARADVNDLIAFVRNWLNTSANVDALLLGQS